MSNEDPEYLETGYDATTPVDDTYLRRFLLNWGETTEKVAQSLGGHGLRGDAFWASDTGRPSSFINTATLMRPLGTDAMATMIAIDDFYSLRDSNEPREVLLFSAWPTPDLREYGWSLGGHPPVHLLPANSLRKCAPDSIRIVPATSIDLLRTVEQVAIDGYPFPGLAPGEVFGPSLLDDPKIRFWVALDDERPVGLAAASVNFGINQVMLVVTLPEARGRGIGEALTWEASLIDPTLPAMLLSSDLGRPVYERMGFLALFRFTLWYRSR